MNEKASSVVDFLKTGVWLLPEEGLSRAGLFFLKSLRVLLLAFRGFGRDQCAVMASAMTFYSLLSVVPVFAVVFAIAKGFGYDKRLQVQLLVDFPEWSDMLVQVFRFSDVILEKTSEGILAGLGIALLLWSAVKLIGSTEVAFNRIWKVRKSRTIARQFTDYLAFAIVCPLIFFMASSLTVTLAARVKSIAEGVAWWGIPPTMFHVLLEVLPLALIWALFAFVFIYMPNTKVRPGPGILAAIAAGTVYHLTQWVYITFQVVVAKSNAIYGSFAALPLFLIWLQVSWLIFLMGAEIAFALQNVETHGFPEESERVTPHHRKILSLLIGRILVKSFSSGEKPPVPSSISRALKVPLPLVRRILEDLSAVGLFTAVQPEGNREPGWQPARDIHEIRVKTVLDALERYDSGGPAFTTTGAFREVAETMDALGAALDASPANKLLLDL